MPTTTSFYDQQASVFDQRVGLSLPRCKQVVATIEQLCGFNQQATLIEMGCGTGELGLLLAAHFKRYVGIDFSLAMLKQYKSRDQTDSIPLIQADGNATWPVANQQADIIFSSRAIHWIDPMHTVNEIYRIANNKHALLIIGRVERARDSWESQLRKQCHQLLKQHHLTPLDGGQHLTKLCERFRDKNAEIQSPQVVYQWQQERSYQQSLHDWVMKTGLAGTTPSAAIKQKILTKLEAWAVSTFGHKVPTQAERRYVLYPIKL